MLGCWHKATNYNWWKESTCVWSENCHTGAFRLPSGKCFFCKVNSTFLFLFAGCCFTAFVMQPNLFPCSIQVIFMMSSIEDWVQTDHITMPTCTGVCFACLACKCLFMPQTGSWGSWPPWISIPCKLQSWPIHTAYQGQRYISSKLEWKQMDGQVRSFYSTS